MPVPSSMDFILFTEKCNAKAVHSESLREWAFKNISKLIDASHKSFWIFQGIEFTDIGHGFSGTHVMQFIAGNSIFAIESDHLLLIY